MTSIGNPESSDRLDVNAAARLRVSAPDMASDADAGLSIERGFVALLRWLVAEGDMRGIQRMAVELRALREAITTLDETRLARDEHAQRIAELDHELQAALGILGPDPELNGSSTLVQRLVRARERLAEDRVRRDQLAMERDAWRSMCTLLTQTRAGAHAMLEEAERGQQQAKAEVEVLKARVLELVELHNDAVKETTAARDELSSLRSQLAGWSDTVERALSELLESTRHLRDLPRPPLED